MYKYNDGLIPCGSVVRYAPNWCEPGERHFRFVVLESYDKGALIGCMNTSISLGYTERVTWEMIEEVI